MFSSWSVRVSEVSFSLVIETFTSGITPICETFSPLLLSPGDIPSSVTLALDGPVRTGCPGPAYDHQPQSASAAAPAVSLPGQTTRCRSPPHRPLCHLWFYCERQLSLQWTRWPLCASRGLQTQPSEDKQHGEQFWQHTTCLLRCCVTLESADGFILSPFVCVFGWEWRFGVLFPPLPCYSAVRWYVLLKLKAAVKTGY